MGVLRADLVMACSCSPDARYVDADLTIGDAGHIRAWIGLHDQPGHEITTTIRTSWEPTTAADPVGPSAAYVKVRRAFLRLLWPSH